MSVSRWVAVALVALSGSAARGQQVLYEFYGDSVADTFGSICRAGDVDGDGHEDILVGARFDSYATHSGGSAFLYDGVDGAVKLVFYSLNSYSAFGLSVGGAGDVNADGFPDVIIGAPYEDNSGGIDAGGAWVYSGRNGTTLLHVKGDDDADKFGYGVEGVGDADGDGYGDVIVGAPSDDFGGAVNNGRAFVFSGKTGQAIHTFVGDSAGDRFGSFCSPVGDLDHDGVLEVAVGAPLDDDNGDGSGSVRVFSGATGAALFTLFGDAPGDHLGFAIDGAGDFNGDGAVDLLLGVMHAGAAGLARVHSGSDGSLLHLLHGASSGDLFGTTVAGLGDLDGDGRDELAIGAPGSQAVGVHSGRAYVMKGGDGALHFVVDAAGPGDGMGWVNDGGDIDNDGLPDLLLGSVLDNVFGVQSGSARAIAGCAPCAFEHKGGGCGKGGEAAPSLTLSGVALPGGEVTLGIQGGAPASSAFLLVGSPSGGVDVAGCTWFVGPGAGLIGPIALSADGAFFFTTTLSPDAPPGSVAMQAAVIDNTAASGFTVSSAAILNIP